VALCRYITGRGWLVHEACPLTHTFLARPGSEEDAAIHDVENAKIPEPCAKVSPRCFTLCDSRCFMLCEGTKRTDLTQCFFPTAWTQLIEESDIQGKFPTGIDSLPGSTIITGRPI
jgi:hypothetical protein